MLKDIQPQICFYFKTKSLTNKGKFGLYIRNRKFKVFQLSMLLKCTPMLNCKTQIMRKNIWLDAIVIHVIPRDSKAKQKNKVRQQ